MEFSIKEKKLSEESDLNWSPDSQSVSSMIVIPWSAMTCTIKIRVWGSLCSWNRLYVDIDILPLYISDLHNLLLPLIKHKEAVIKDCSLCFLLTVKSLTVWNLCS